MKANERWSKSYRQDGYLIVPDLLDPATLSDLRKAMKKITDGEESLPPHLKDKLFLERDHVKNSPKWYEGSLTPDACGACVRQIADLALFDPALARLICYEPMLDVLEVLFDSTEFSFTPMVGRPKPAIVGNGVRNGAFHRRYARSELHFRQRDPDILCLDSMTPDNGPTIMVRGSHKISDEEAKKPCWERVAQAELNTADIIAVCCPAGSGLFFSSKILHAAGHNRSKISRRTINFEWAGPDALTTSRFRFAYQGLKPRSKDAAFARQITMTFNTINTVSL